MTQEANSFAMGWAVEIRKKVTKFALNDREQVLLDQYVDKTVGKNEDGTHKESKGDETVLSAAAMFAGREAAKQANLHRPVGDNGEAAPLLSQTKLLGGK